MKRAKGKSQPNVSLCCNDDEDNDGNDENDNDEDDNDHDDDDFCCIAVSAGRMSLLFMM